jgi:hypothetical protein
MHHLQNHLISARKHLQWSSRPPIRQQIQWIDFGWLSNLRHGKGLFLADRSHFPSDLKQLQKVHLTLL